MPSKDTRPLILKLLDEGKPPVEVAKIVGVTKQRVYHVRKTRDDPPQRSGRPPGRVRNETVRKKVLADYLAGRKISTICRVHKLKHTGDVYRMLDLENVTTRRAPKVGCRGERKVS